MHLRTTFCIVFLLTGCGLAEQATQSPADTSEAGPVVAPTPRPADESSAAAPTEPETDDQDETALPPPAPAEAPVSAPPAAKTAEAAPDAPLTVQQQLAIFDQLQQRILKLQHQLQQAAEQNQRLKAALLESRETAGNLQGELNRAAILRQIQKREVAELRQRLAALDASAGDEANGGETGEVAASAAAEGDKRVDAIIEAGRLKQENEKLRLQLELATIEETDERNRKLLEQLRETTQTLQKVEAQRRQFSRLAVKQADEIRALRERQQQMERQISDLQSAPPEPVPPSPAPDKPDIVAVAPQPTEPTDAPDTPPTKPADTDLAAAPENTPSEPPAAPAPEPKRIHGRIKELGEAAIIINIGSAKGVEPGMRLIVYREDKFVGYIETNHVQQDEAAGTMKQRIREPKVGDYVIDRLE
ncbi:MAG: hypothetical protein KGY81_03345 [Phycisphaerae bacterium]|nr:hypothetical protein [Phycisphaerae bacterium]